MRTFPSSQVTSFPSFKSVKLRTRQFLGNCDDEGTVFSLFSLNVTCVLVRHDLPHNLLTSPIKAPTPKLEDISRAYFCLQASPTLTLTILCGSTHRTSLKGLHTIRRFSTPQHPNSRGFLRYKATQSSRCLEGSSSNRSAVGKTHGRSVSLSSCYLQGPSVHPCNVH